MDQFKLQRESLVCFIVVPIVYIYLTCLIREKFILHKPRCVYTGWVDGHIQWIVVEKIVRGWWV